jgi:hypothetical protein
MGVPLQTPVPELVTQAGLATSNTGSFRAGPKRSNALVVGLPLAVLAAGGMIAVAIIMSQGDRGAASGVSAASSTEAAPSAAPALTAAADAAAGQGPAGAPSGDASAAPSPSGTAQAAGTSSSKVGRPGGGRPTSVKPPPETTNKPAGKRPEIRSPFE